MFRCENDKCNQIVYPRQPVNYIVIERRDRNYEYKIKKGKKKGQIAIANGWEIVKEIKVCPKCYRILTGKTPRMVENKSLKSEFKSKPKVIKENRRKKEWKNPKQKKNKQDNTEVKEVRKPIVEIINPLPLVKE